MKKSTGFPTTLVFLFGILIAMLYGNPAWGQSEEASYAPGGAKDCLECHDEGHEAAILNTPHAQRADGRSPFSANDCETCHGPSPQHRRKVEGQEIPPPPNIVFGLNSPTPVDKQNAVCLDCHDDGARMNWSASQHHSADIPCAACHTAHAVKDPVLVKAMQAPVCYTCHAEQKAQSFRRSRHPIKEGKVTCTDCHNPHGSIGPKLLKEASVNDTCYTCHTEKRGPFLWEHAPVQDDCTNCHTPHGSTQARLLKVRTPFLCQTCHLEAYHPSSLYSGTGIPPLGAGERILASGCLNCHTKVHGSNHPSGVRFTR
jgi:DmsE family decaheme c-type cytochrome